MDYRIVRNDISDMSADAIVLPANPALVEGSGASAALFQKAGRGYLKRACRNLHNKMHKEHKDIAVGTAVPTLAYKLSADYIVHAIVPKWIDGNHHEYGLLSAAYLSSLGLADAMGCKSIAFPLLAAGNNGYDVDLAFQIAGRSIEEYQPENTLETVYIVLYGYDAKLANDCSIETLASIFEKNVVPLLQEYFYEDYEKIQLVLGDNSKEDEFKFILDYPIKVKDIFNGSPDIDLPEKGYSIQHDAFLKLDSYKKIGRDL